MISIINLPLKTMYIKLILRLSSEQFARCLKVLNDSEDTNRRIEKVEKNIVCSAFCFFFCQLEICALAIEIEALQLTI